MKTLALIALLGLVSCGEYDYCTDYCEAYTQTLVDCDSAVNITYTTEEQSQIIQACIEFAEQWAYKGECESKLNNLWVMDCVSFWEYYDLI